MPFTSRHFTSPPLGEPWELNRDSPQAAGLVAWWPTVGDAGSARIRDYVQSNAGTFAAGMSWNVNAVRGPMPLFSGSGTGADNDYISLARSIALGTTHTVAYWAILNNSAVNETGMPVGGGSGHYVGYYYASTQYYSAGGTVVSASVAYTRGTLAHFAVVRDGTAVKFYLNGRQKGTTQTLSANSALTVNIIGAYTSSFTYCLNGQLSGLLMSLLPQPDSVIAQMYSQPWDLYMVRRRFWAVKAAGWNAAWARNVNTLLGGGAERRA